MNPYSYDVVRCSHRQWELAMMRALARLHFDVHPECNFVRVQEHAGWFLGWTRDGQIWSTANGHAYIDPSVPRPTNWSGVTVEYPELGPALALVEG